MCACGEDWWRAFPARASSPGYPRTSAAHPNHVPHAFVMARAPV